MAGPWRAARGAVATWRGRAREAAAARTNRDRASHCFYCEAPFGDVPGLARTVDHRVPRGAGGTDGLANLVFACEACNQRKADTPEAIFVASEWLLRRRREIRDAAGRPEQ
jgi:5-methylcytosine-specific restriction endonuclease McrA